MEPQAKLLSVLNAEEGLLAKFLYQTGKVWLVYSNKSRRGYFAQGHKVDLNWSKWLKTAHWLIERIETLKVSLSATLSRHTSSQATVTPSRFKHARFSRSEPKQATSCRDLKPPLDWFSQVSCTSQVCNSALRLERYQTQFLILEVIYAVVQGTLLSIRLFGCVDKWVSRGMAAIPCLSTVN
jgi:hypothetical protein